MYEALYLHCVPAAEGFLVKSVQGARMSWLEPTAYYFVHLHCGVLPTKTTHVPRLHTDIQPVRHALPSRHMLDAGKRG